MEPRTPPFDLIFAWRATNLYGVWACDVMTACQYPFPGGAAAVQHDATIYQVYTTMQGQISFPWIMHHVAYYEADKSFCLSTMRGNPLRLIITHLYRQPYFQIKLCCCYLCTQLPDTKKSANIYKPVWFDLGEQGGTKHSSFKPTPRYVLPCLLASRPSLRDTGCGWAKRIRTHHHRTKASAWGNAHSNEATTTRLAHFYLHIRTVFTIRWQSL
jgi:hypothetical protein